jgi:hypothetical protein
MYVLRSAIERWASAKPSLTAEEKKRGSPRLYDYQAQLLVPSIVHIELSSSLLTTFSTVRSTSSVLSALKPLLGELGREKVLKSVGQTSMSSSKLIFGADDTSTSIEAGAGAEMMYSSRLEVAGGVGVEEAGEG